MSYFFRFRRYILLLLSLTLSAQAMALASLGACHRMKALVAIEQVVLAMPHHGSSNAHHHADSAAHDASSTHDADSGASGTGSGDDKRVSCAACAVCHLASAIPSTLTVAADIPVAGSSSFPRMDVPCARNVASGLERPPRA
jgi:hypothetical protein